MDLDEFFDGLCWALREDSLDNWKIHNTWEANWLHIPSGIVITYYQYDTHVEISLSMRTASGQVSINQLSVEYGRWFQDVEDAYKSFTLRQDTHYENKRIEEMNSFLSEFEGFRR